MKLAPVRLFISYSHKDEALKDSLLEHLAVLEQFQNIGTWNDSRIGPGNLWRKEVETALNRADVALLLVSASFLASKFIQDFEIPRLLKRQANSGVVIVPVILRACVWEAHPVLKEFNALPMNRVPITRYQGGRRDEILTEVSREILTLARSVDVTRLDTRVVPIESRSDRNSDLPIPFFTERDSAERAPDSATPIVSIEDFFEDPPLRNIEQVEIVCIDAEDDCLCGVRFTLKFNPTHVGRSETCHIRLTDVGISRNHAHMELRNGRLFLIDDGSTNGTFRNSERVGGGIADGKRMTGETRLKHRDNIQFGKSVKMRIIFR